MLNYLDLFSGIGGFHEGLKQAGFSFGWVGYSEIDKYAKQVYQNHFKVEDLGDVRTITTDKLTPKINLVTFGFPCQDLSVAGKRAGLAGKRSGLFGEAIRLIRDTKPDYFIFENVKGLFSSNQGRDFEYILRAIADIGYDGQWQLLNTRWVLPQNRERIYFVGHIRGKCRPEVFPLGESIGTVSETRDGEGISGCLGTRSGSGQANFDGSTTLIANCLDANYSKGDNHPNNKSGRTLIQDRSLDKVIATQLNMSKQFGNHINSDTFMTLRASEPNGVILGNRIRRLTPIECERLQGFKDGWTSGISDSQRYKCLGNAVTVPIVKLIGEKMLKYW